MFGATRKLYCFIGKPKRKNLIPQQKNYLYEIKGGKIEMIKVTSRGQERLGKPREELPLHDKIAVLRIIAEASSSTALDKIHGIWRQRDNTCNESLEGFRIFSVT